MSNYRIGMRVVSHWPFLVKLLERISGQRILAMTAQEA